MSRYAVAVKPPDAPSGRVQVTPAGKVLWGGSQQLNDAQLATVRKWAKDRWHGAARVQVHQLAGGSPFHVIEAEVPMRRTSGNHEQPGVHAAGSFHYLKAPEDWMPDEVCAYDYGDAFNSHANLIHAATIVRASGTRYAGARVREVFGPFPWHVKDGQVFSGMEPGHGDHLHLAFTL